MAIPHGDKLTVKIKITERFLYEYFLPVAREGKPGIDYPVQLFLKPSRTTDGEDYKSGTVWQQYNNLTNPRNTDTYAVDRYPELKNLYLYHETVMGEDGTKVQKVRVTVHKDISKQFAGEGK